MPDPTDKPRRYEAVRRDDGWYVLDTATGEDLGLPWTEAAARTAALWADAGAEREAAPLCEVIDRLAGAVEAIIEDTVSIEALPHSDLSPAQRRERADALAAAVRGQADRLGELVTDAQAAATASRGR